MGANWPEPECQLWSVRGRQPDAALRSQSAPLCCWNGALDWPRHAGERSVETVRDALQSLNLGKSVAEFDDALESYFVETNAFRELVRDQRDIIAGDKGTGKTAIYRILQKKYTSLPELRKIEVIPAFNPSGSPIFQQLTTREVLSEAEYNRLWKAYLVSYAGNWLLQLYDGEFTASMSNLDKLLRGLELRTEVDAPRNSFARALSKIGAMFNWRSAEMECAISESGMPVIKPKVEFADTNEPKAAPPSIPADASLRLLDRCLEEADITVWIALDRLDEAFSGMRHFLAMPVWRFQPFVPCFARIWTLQSSTGSNLSCSSVAIYLVESPPAVLLT